MTIKTPIKIQPWQHTILEAIAKEYGITKTTLLECVLVSLGRDGISKIADQYYNKQEVTTQ